MNEYTPEELADALRVVEASIVNCEKAQRKFAEGTAQHSLLRNRLAALRIARALIGGGPESYTRGELSAALAPLASIAAKCEKGRQKHAAGSPTHRRLTRLIAAASLSHALVEEALARRDT